ncbi:hypothetical protein ScPMuIL_004806 [Solemya velum]
MEAVAKTVTLDNQDSNQTLNNFELIDQSTVSPRDNTISVDDGTLLKAKSIQAIDRGTVHRICSGQVVLTLATAVKELVENSVDAGATIIDIKLKDYGSTLIEVSDNGCGVEQSNFSGLTLKHHTSKLQDFSDLINVETFGFRGEALSSLCALSDLSVVTKHTQAQVGTKLEFDHHGNIKSQVHQARQKGTTVVLQNLFYTLPVRHKEFNRNVKKEFSKMVQILNSYCIISSGVKVTCTNQTPKGNKSTIISTKGNSSIRENIANIFGPKQLQNLLEFKQVDPSEEVCTEYGLKLQEKSMKLFRIGGFISKCEHGLGRSSTDRQFYFINKRPCDSVKLVKVINDVYHQYNRHQYPFVVMDITIDRESVDVNVTPDKRKIFVENEKILLAIIKASLVQLFEPTMSLYQVTQPVKSQSGGFSMYLHTGEPCICSICNSHDRTLKKECISGTLARLKRSFSSAFAKDDQSAKPKTPSSSLNKNSKRNYCISRMNHYTFVSKSQTPEKEVPQLLTNSVSDQKTNESRLDLASSSQMVEDDSDTLNSQDTVILINQEHHTISSSGISSMSYSDDSLPKSTLCEIDSQFSDNHNEGPVLEETSSDGGHSKVDLLVKENLESDLLQFSKKMGVEAWSCVTEQDSECCRKFRATIAPDSNQEAESELQKEMKKEMFGEMEILGQFNLGFIITKLGTDLFIVDQHATDEKYNFEMLQKHTVIQSQKLIQPQTLELTACNETILMDNLEIFKKNGFDFIIDENAQPTQRVKLVSTPISKNWHFGKEDIEELIFMLTDSPGVLCRPSRVRQMFASRSCRKSIMIGTALNKTEMKKLICHMGELEQPWNCPHGRPTMRHLIDLNMIPR